MKKSELLRGLSLITQFGLSVATAPILCVLFGVWAQKRWNLGDWVVIVCLLVGIISGACSFASFIRTARRAAEKKEERDEGGQNR